VAAKHSNGVDPVFLTNPPGDNLTAYVGPEQGYVIAFSNGLVVYLSGDTGVISDMDTVVRQQYRAELAVINIGDVFSTGPEEAAFAINNLIKPKAVIPSHANEEATSDSQVISTSKTQRFIDLVGGAKVHVPLSGVAMHFNGNGICVSGC
jgi:L-ascorbate metabolism protein UlaG (beta-lactamase superfamily)